MSSVPVTTAPKTKLSGQELRDAYHALIGKPAGLKSSGKFTTKEKLEAEIERLRAASTASASSPASSPAAVEAKASATAEVKTPAAAEAKAPAAAEVKTPVFDRATIVAALKEMRLQIEAIEWSLGGVEYLPPCEPASAAAETKPKKAKKAAKAKASPPASSEAPASAEEKPKRKAAPATLAWQQFVKDCKTKYPARFLDAELRPMRLAESMGVVKAIRAEMPEYYTTFVADFVKNHATMTTMAETNAKND
jgi:hypothetical protein